MLCVSLDSHGCIKTGSPGLFTHAPIFFTAYLDIAEPQDKISRIAAAMAAKDARREESHSALVPRKDGSSLEMVVARNAGEARHAKRDTKLVTQQRQWDKHALKIGKVHNSQKHVSSTFIGLRTHKWSLQIGIVELTITLCFHSSGTIYSSDHVSSSRYPSF